jgi:RNA polymerase sigma-70 factor (ECF subfamily)
MTTTAVSRDQLEERARAGDRSALADLLEAYRRELGVHCYRMTGSFTESEDLAQEVMARAWSGFAAFEGRASVRTWLYRIATHLCLDHLKSAERRVLPMWMVAPVGAGDDPEGVHGKRVAVEPYPTTVLTGTGQNAPEVTSRETVELIFLAAIQHLTAHQRAVLILRDVLDWPASAAGEVLGLSVPAVKSALQRARGALRERLPADRHAWSRPSARAEDRALLDAYVDCMHRDDLAGLAEVLHADLRVNYANQGFWFADRQSFLDTTSRQAPPGEYAFVTTSANLCPAVGIYLRVPGGAEFRLVAVEVLTTAAGRIVDIVDFDGEEPSVRALGLAPTLPTGPS